MMFEIIRDNKAGSAQGGLVLSEKLAFTFLIRCAAVKIVMGREEAWLTRDEAIELAHALQDAARDG